MVLDRQASQIRLSQKGMTAIELLITISIASILMAVAAPSFTSTLVKYRLSTNNSNLVADIILARSEALKRSATVSVCQSNNGTSCTATGWGSGRIVFVDSGTAGQIDTGDTVLKVSAAVASGDTITATFPATFIQYAATGAVSTSGILTVCRATYSGRQVAIRAVGRISTLKLNGLCP
jgi:type IV fimbrial biogenesis protein FimT